MSRLEGQPLYMKRSMRMLLSILATVLFLVLPGALSMATAETEAAREFKKISDELRSRQAMLAPEQYLRLIEQRYGDFIKKYPKAPEALQAHLYLGKIYSAAGMHDRAVKHLGEYIKSATSKDSDLIAQVRLVMAQSYASLENYDEAEKLLREVLSSQVAVDSRLMEAARGELGRIAALRKIKIGSPAPNISGTTYDGRKVDLEKLRGKVVLIDFWAVWCTPCRLEMPSVISIYKDFKKKGLEIIGVSLDSDRNQFETFVQQNKMEWPQLFDGKGWATRPAQTYAVNAIPATALIDRKGILRYRNLRGPKLRSAIEELIAEK